MAEFNIIAPEVKRENHGDPIIDLISYPILNDKYHDPISEVIHIKNTCGDDGCQSNLKITAKMPSEVTGGEDQPTLLTIHAANDGEEAHQAYIEVYLPPLVDFVRSNITNPSSADISCYSAISGESAFVKCSLGNPYKSGMSDTIEIVLSTVRLDERTKSIDIRIDGHTTSSNPKIAPIALQANVIVNLDISLNTFAHPDQVRYAENQILGDSAMSTVDQIGPKLEYNFNIENAGEKTAYGVVLSVDLPTELCNGKWLLYLVLADLQAGSCNSTHMNTLKLRPTTPANLRSKRSTPSYTKAPIEARRSTTGGNADYTLTLSKDGKKCDETSPDAFGVRSVTVTCELDALEPGSSSSVVMQIHVWEATFLEEFRSIDLVYIKTSASLDTREQNVRFRDGPVTSEIETTVDHFPFTSEIRGVFPWWDILIAAIGLLVIYALVFILLKRHGFFTRKKFHCPEEDNAVLEEEKTEDTL